MNEVVIPKSLLSRLHGGCGKTWPQEWEDKIAEGLRVILYRL